MPADEAPRPRTTLVCVPITVDADDHASALDNAQRATHAGADIVEYRIDRLFQGEGDDVGIAATLDLCARSPLPCIVTCRPTWEGGEYDGEDTDRVSLFEALGTSDHPPAYIDIELAAYTRSANLRQKVNLAVQHPDQVRDVRTRLILSSHDFERRPADLSRRRADMAAHPAAAVHKVAYRARSIRDTIECFEIMRDAPAPTIAIAMGEHGLASRILAPKFGGFLTFAALDHDQATAPGQPTIHEFASRYRFDTINPSTRVFGVIGDPVSHSKSPALHNAVMQELNVDGVYLPMPIARGQSDDDAYISFKATLGAMLDFAPLDFTGASVTIPHKQNAVRFAAEDSTRTWSVDPLVQLSGAANTISIDPDAGQGSLHNTDATAIRHLLEPHAQDGSATIVGAGGVARAAAAACVDLGMPATLLARRPEQARALIEAITHHRPDATLHAADFEARLEIESQVAIQCTPIGMATGPDPQGTALRFASTAASQVLLETVYTPVRTPAAAQAERSGATVITGDTMFIAQAIEQAAIWHGDAARAEHITRTARQAIASD